MHRQRVTYDLLGQTSYALTAHSSCSIWLLLGFWRLSGLRHSQSIRLSLTGGSSLTTPILLSGTYPMPTGGAER